MCKNDWATFLKEQNGKEKEQVEDIHIALSGVIKHLKADATRMTKFTWTKLYLISCRDQMYSFGISGVFGKFTLFATSHHLPVSSQVDLC